MHAVFGRRFADTVRRAVSGGIDMECPMRTPPPDALQRTIVSHIEWIGVTGAAIGRRYARMDEIGE